MLSVWLLSSFLTFAHAAPDACEDQLLNRAQTYAQLVDVGLTHGWIHESHLARTKDGDLQLLKLNEADPTTFPLAKALQDLIARMSPEEKHQSLENVRTKLTDIAKEQTRQADAKAKTAEILSPHIVAEWTFMAGTFSFNGLDFLPRLGKRPLVVFAPDRLYLLDPDDRQNTTSLDPEGDVDVHRNGDRLLFLEQTKSHGGWRDFLLRDASKPNEPPQKLGRLKEFTAAGHLWFQTPTGRDFLVLTVSDRFTVFEVKDGQAEERFSKSNSRFDTLLSNAKGDVRVICDHFDLEILDGNNGSLLKRWHPQHADRDFSLLQGYIADDGEVFIKFYARKSDFIFTNFYLRQSEDAASSENRIVRANGLWHKMSDGRIVFAIPPSTSDFSKEDSTVRIVEPFHKDGIKVWNTGLHDNLGPHSHWLEGTDELLVDSSTLRIYRFSETLAPQLIAKIRPPLPVKELSIVPDFKSGDRILIINGREVAIGHMNGTVQSLSLASAKKSKIFIDAEREQIYVATFESQDGQLRVRLFELYGTPK